MNEQYTLPKNWRWVKLGEVCEIVTGNTPSRAKPEFFGSGTPWLTPRDINESMYVREGQEEVTDVGIKLGRAHILEEQSVLLVCIGATVGKVAIATRRLCVNQQINALICSNDTSPEFLYYTLLFLRLQIIDLASTATLPIINQTTLKNFSIPLPPMNEQKRIAAKIQELMQEVKQAKESCEKQLEAAQALPSAYLREVFDSPEAKKWERKRLGEVVEDSQSGIWGEEPFGIPNEDLLPVLRSTEIDHRGNIKVNDKTVAMRKIKKESAERYFLLPDDLLIVRSGGTTGKIILGRVGIYKGQPNRYLFSNFLLRIRLNEQLTVPDYMWFFLNWDKFLEENIPRLMRRTTGIQNLPMDDYFTILILLPPKVEQKCIVAELKEKINESKNLQSAIRNQQSTIDALPQAILRKAFRGEL